MAPPPSRSRSRSPIVFNEDMEPDEIMRSGRRALERIDILEQELARAKRPVDQVDGRAASPPAQRRHTQTNGNDPDDAEDEKQKERFLRVLTYAGKTFAIMHTPLLNRSFTFDAILRDDWRSEARYRFSSSENIAQGQLREVLALTSEYEDARKDASFQDAFLSGMKDERDKFSKIRKGTPKDKIWGDRGKYLEDEEKRREHFKDDLGWDEEEGAYSPIDAPFHHKDGVASDGYDVATAFRGLIPKKVFACLAFGPESAPSIEKGHVVAPARGLHMAKVLHLTHTTPGAIATSTMLAFWAMSPDPLFVEEGKASGINYAELSDQFLQTLLSGLERRSKHTLELFAEWDRIFFPATKDQGCAARAGWPDTGGNGSRASRAIERAMARLAQDEQMSEEEANDG